MFRVFNRKTIYEKRVVTTTASEALVASAQLQTITTNEPVMADGDNGRIAPAKKENNIKSENEHFIILQNEPQSLELFC